MTIFYSNQMLGRPGNQPTEVGAQNVFGTAGTNAPNSPTISNCPGRPHTVANANFPEATVIRAAEVQPQQHHWQSMTRNTEAQSNSPTSAHSQAGATQARSNSEAGAHQFQATQVQAIQHPR